MGKAQPKKVAAVVASKQKKKATTAWLNQTLPWLVVILAVGAAVFLASGDQAPPRPGEPEVMRKPPDADKHADCSKWAAAGECMTNAPFMHENCATACQRTGTPRDTHNASECIAWAGNGECDSNPEFMLSSCQGSCSKVNAQRDAYAARCKRTAGESEALAPGTMNATFERVMSDYAHLEPEMVSSDPPVILFHRFLSDSEAGAFVSHGKGKYAESLGVGMTKDGKMGDVKTEIRTSAHTWCQSIDCLSDPAVRAVVARVHDLTQTPEANGEFAQLVYYRACPEEGHPNCAFYRRHSDYIEGDRYKVQGVRIYTIFMYLNDVPEGGATRFTDLPSGPITFQPVRGKAILWPSVLEDKPHERDPRTHHEALPVTRGEKFGANFWIHQYDFKGPHATGCTH